MFVSLDKLSQLPTGGHAPPRPPKQQPAAQSAVQPAAKSGGKRKKKAYRFKIQDRVVAFNKYGVPIHGTVRWVGPYALLDEKKQPFNVAAVGVETVSFIYILFLLGMISFTGVIGCESSRK